MKPINVIDAPCGAGKTSWAIQYMNENAEHKNWIFITPYLDEVDRIKTECGPQCFFEEPLPDTSKTKSEHLKELLKDGENIVSTHKLFSMVDDEAITLIKNGQYTLILDEVMEVVEHFPIKKPDVEILVDKGLITIDEDGKVRVPEDAPAYEEGRFEDVIKEARLNRLIYVADSMMMWRFPVEAFEAFEECYTMTFLFDGQIQKRYFEAYCVPHEYWTIQKSEKGHNLIPYDEKRELSDFKTFVREHVSVHEGRGNRIGKRQNSLSKSWFEKARPERLKELGKMVRSFFYQSGKVKADNAGWCVFEDFIKKVDVNGYKGCHITHNIRASNEYRRKTVMAYCVNKYPHVPESQFFKHIGLPIDEKKYALCEMIQWIWRSAIREGHTIDLFIPSKRMREIFKEFFGYT